jgi:hypothetical protein
MWLLAERANDYYSQVEGSTYLERFACQLSLEQFSFAIDKL